MTEANSPHSGECVEAINMPRPPPRPGVGCAGDFIAYWFIVNKTNEPYIISNKLYLIDFNSGQEIPHFLICVRVRLYEYDET